MIENEPMHYEPQNNSNMPKKESKFLAFLGRHKFSVFLLFVILGIAIWSSIKISLLKNDFESKEQALITQYELKIDSLNSERLLLNAKSFSWAIRSELMRENKEQINQYFNEFIKNTDVIKLQLINPETSIIELSTDKKDVDATNSSFNLIEDQLIKKEADKFVVVTPISGLNKKIGIFVMEFKRL